MGELRTNRECEMLVPHRKTPPPEPETPLNRFSAAVIHGLKNPLTGALANAQLAADGLRQERISREDIAESLRIVEAEIKRMSATVQDLMKLSRRDEAPTSPVDLAALLRDCSKTWRASLVAQNISYTLTTPNGPVVCLGHEEQLREVMGNLVENAMQAMETVSLRNLSITLTLHEASVAVEIVDTGPGISHQNQERVFDPFFTTKPIGKGTGLGLAICREIILAHGGTLTLRSESGKGTTFEISLPKFTR